MSEGGPLAWHHPHHAHHHAHQHQQQQHTAATVAAAQFGDEVDGDMAVGGGRRSGEMTVKKWEEEEALANKATISSVLYANIKHPNLRNDIPGQLLK